MSGGIDNFLKAARRKTGEYRGQRYSDTDIYTDLYRFAPTTDAAVALSVNGRPYQARLDKGYAHVGRTWRAGLMGGLQVIRGDGVLAIPYFAWNNRGQGAMAVWVKQ